MKRAVLSLIGVAFAVLLCGGQARTEVGKQEARSLFPVSQKGKWGYIDRTGRMVIKPQFDHATGFAEGLAAVRVDYETGKDRKLLQLLGTLAGARARLPDKSRRDWKWGYIDETGKYVIRPQFRMVQDFSEGLAAAGDTKFGYIDKTGAFAIQPQFDYGKDFHQGLAAVRVGDKLGESGKWGYVDKTGNFVIPLQFDNAEDFREGLAVVTVERKDGYVDHSGKFVISPQFRDAHSFCEGLAAVTIGEGESEKTAYIDKTGKAVLESDVAVAGDFCDGLAPVGREMELVPAAQPGLIEIRGKWGYIDTAGTMVVEPQFNDARGFSEGLAAVNLGGMYKGKWGYIDRTGKMLILPQFDSAQDFSGGLAEVRVGAWAKSRRVGGGGYAIQTHAGKLGYIDKTGKYVWKPQE